MAHLSNTRTILDFFFLSVEDYINSQGRGDISFW